jgi:NAD(P)-dependent dehydrogenase (short-subunit alcohol dehydrogenase family)
MEQRIALVTGASSGIGAAIAAKLAADGHRVFGTGRKPGANVGEVEMVALDVTDDASVSACVDGVIAKAGKLDILVNNAGYLLPGAVEEASMAEIRAQLETNFFGVVRMFKAIVPHMRERRSGHLITISSLAGIVPVPFWGYYNASKFAVEGLCETLRYEMKPFGVKVALVEPGAIKTPLYRQPHAMTMAEYARWREPALNTMAAYEAKAPGPDVVGALVAKIARKPNPKLRYKITREAKMFPFLRWLLPAGAYESGVRSGFKLPSD